MCPFVHSTFCGAFFHFPRARARNFFYKWGVIFLHEVVKISLACGAESHVPGPAAPGISGACGAGSEISFGGRFTSGKVAKWTQVRGGKSEYQFPGAMKSGGR